MMRRDIYNNIVKAARLLSLVVLMAFGAGLKGWGQNDGDKRTIIFDSKCEWTGTDSENQRIVNTTDATSLGGDWEVIYAAEGKKSLSIQDGGGAENLDGYIRWYVITDVSDIKNIDKQSVDNLILPTIYNNNAAYGKILQFQNGIAWLRGIHSEEYQIYNGRRKKWETTGSANDVEDSSPGEICSIEYDVPSDFEKIYVVCEASSMNNVTKNETENSNITWTAPMVTFRHVFEIRPANQRYEILNAHRNNLSKKYNDWKSNSNTFLQLVAVDKSDLFLESYDIHTPLTSGTDSNGNPLNTSEIGTNYRIGEDLSNYYISNIQTANRTVWYVFNSNGEFKGTSGEIGSNIWSKTFGDREGIDISSTSTQILYLVAVVKRNGSDQEYPAAFFKLYLEPYTEPLTEDELNKNKGNSNYSIRSEEYLNQNGYRLISSVQFEEESDVDEMLRVENNYAPGPMSNASSYYAYAYPGEFIYRKSNRLSAGRGEYGLYRSLNYTEISKGEVTIDNKTGVYNDYFASNSGVYNKYIFDRTFDTTRKYGYFFYLDATDDPGVITNIELPDDLCPNTQLVVTAWICDMAHSRSATHADVGLTFKGISSDGSETILNRFYSGKIMNKPTEWGDKTNYEQADWQQIYFNFSYQDLGYSSYVLEISNNAPNSNGADYAVDDIKLWRSTPNIEVIRLDACEADSLTVSSDYHTLLRNMAYSENSTTVTDWNSVVRRTGNADGSESIDVELLKYRLGLNGAPVYDGSGVNFLTQANFESYIFNSYFSFVEGLDDSRPDAVTRDTTSTDNLGVEELKPILLGPTDLETGEEDVYRWVRINKDLSEYDPRVVFSYRTIVTTRAPQVVGNNVDNYPSTHEEAVKWERVFNLRALQDYNYLCNSWESFTDKLGSSIEKPDWLTNGITIQSGIFGEYLTVSDLSKIKDLDPMTTDEANAYDDLMKTFWSRLDIPRIRVPWYDKDNDIMYLYTVDVRNTDLKSQGELVIEQDGTQKKATGQYHVVLQSASAIASGIGRTLNLKDICTLISPFTLYGSLQITVEAETDLSARACAGTQRKISAQLLSKDDGKPLGVEYSFDWFLGGGYKEYWKISVDGYDLKSMLAVVRADERFSGEITYANVNSWSPADGTKQAIQNKLLELLNPEDAKLVTNKTEFSWLLSADSLVAMPFITEGAANTSYCTEITAAPVPLYSTDVPELHPGFTLNGITYPFKGEVSLRLGRVNMGVNLKLAIPMQAGFENSMAERASSLGLSNTLGVPIMLNNIEAQYPEIGLATDMSIMRGAADGTVTIQLNEEAKTYLQEGQRYELLIPFVQYDGTEPLDSECDGLISLPVKIVPEYLTWKGESADDNWYDESKWNQSTKKELYFNGWDGTGADTDANGSDDVAKAFSPLYFTKITIPEGQELALGESETTEVNGHEFLIGWATDGSDSIRYEMAVANAKGDIVPYYINKVEQIYFKPEATLMNQHYLGYQKAWVDFEMEAGKPYWMSAPLKGVYAGDMYAPSSNGRQETEAFTDITYSETANSRWNPAFYQKAWDKAITYSNNEDGTSTTSINAVKSNWSIEYNDVTVPYSLGKGFYSKVEKKDEGNVLVRLPKADTEYKYETKTRALTNTEKQPSDYGRLADESEIIIDLSKEDTETTQEEVDGDGKHFLVGNPYMTYLNMSEFFNENAKENNPVLVKKYWLLENGASKAIVGTPDVEWVNNETEKDPISSFIPPMTAFFVELSDKAGDDKTIKFTTAMMAAKPTTTDNVYTKSYSASNPILTLTVERGETRSVARLLTSDKGHDEYEASEDAVLLLDSELDAPMVYTVAGDVAAQFNTMQSIKNVPLGVYADKGEEVELTIRGISQFAEKLYLYDAVTKQSTPLDDDSYTFRVTGPSHGRFTLTSQNRISAESDICVYSPIPGQLLVMSSPEEPLQRVQVYDMSGRMVTSRDNIGNTTSQLTVPSGIYVVYAENETGNVRVKVRVR